MYVSMSLCSFVFGFICCDKSVYVNAERRKEVFDNMIRTNKVIITPI